MPVSPSAESRHASWWQLCLLFVLALLLFLMLRWQPESWLRQQIDQQARQSGIDLQYKQLAFEGLSVRMGHVSIRAAELPVPVMLDSLSISPAWSSLWSGAAAVDLKATLSGQSIEAVLVWQDEYIGIHDVHADLDVTVLQSLWKQRITMPVGFSGRLNLSGDVQLDEASGLPVAGQLNARWQQAGVDLPMFDKPLGDYQLALTATANTSGIWQWSLSGGTEVTLSGSGQLDLTGKLPRQWMIDGRVQLQVADQASSIASIFGAQAKVFNISGNLLNARIHE